MAYAEQLILYQLPNSAHLERDPRLFAGIEATFTDGLYLVQ